MTAFHIEEAQQSSKPFSVAANGTVAPELPSCLTDTGAGTFTTGDRSTATNALEQKQSDPLKPRLTRSYDGLVKIERRNTFKMPDGVRWQWEHKTGFRDYVERDNLRIEMAFQRGESKVRIRSGKGEGVPMELFFVDMLQYDPTSENKRRIQRVGPNGCCLRLRRYFRQIYRSWEVGRHQRETFKMYQRRRDRLNNGDDEEEASYDVSNAYHKWRHRPKTFGRLCSRTAQSNLFHVLSMGAVLANAVWLSVDADLNPTFNDDSSTSQTVFDVAEQVFLYTVHD